jgi:hypothetical protein
MIFLMVWWVSVFTATGWLLASGLEKAPSFDLLTGVFA